MTLRRKANVRLRAARLRMKSPSGSGLAMSRRELADLVNAHLAAREVDWLCMDAGHIGKYERGEHIWPQREYREALRAVLGVGSDADLGFHTRRAVDTGPVGRARTLLWRGGVTVAALAGRSDTATVATTGALADTAGRVPADLPLGGSRRSVDA